MSLTGEWKTDRAKFLVSAEFVANTQRLINGGIAGTGKQFDAEKVANGLVDLIFGEITESNQGIHIETALTALGALAGFSAQMAIREFFIKAGKISEEQAFQIAKTNDGQTFYVDDWLNEPLVATQKGAVSIWGFVAGAAEHLGAKTLPDPNEIFRHVVSSIGGEGFGVPRLPAKNMPHASPIELLNRFWNPIRNYLVVNVDNPGAWPLTIGLASQKAMVRAKAVIDPALAARIVMEAAVPMSKIDPARISHAYF